jgi:hypothetical protein
MSPSGTFLPFMALQHHGNYWGYRRHVADGAGRPSLTHKRHWLIVRKVRLSAP